ncbi:peptidase domain-containing ABC transporter [uncultured Flavobacterium sp.]|uniref:peptidase domain-containing ABC transporter n=1 Tax=uncultured Flavobacterium sp. TaxID=165435 RepID=UPI00292DD33A|nr:peptidase domain-containing ABC transporter [uncultured Flavobacterium sp.]
MEFYKKPRVKFYHQLESTDCGAACLCMILSYHGKQVALSQIKKLFEFTRIGISIEDIVQISTKIGLSSTPLKLTQPQLEEIPLPAILFWKQDHFVVLEKIKHRKEKIFYYLADPGYGRITLDSDVFLKEWLGSNEKGVGVVLEPLDDFLLTNNQKEEKKSIFNSPFIILAFKFLAKNKIKYTGAILLILLSLAANFFIPFTFQKIIDTGITPRAMEVVYYLLFAQILLFISRFISDFISHLILTNINFKLSVNLKKDLLTKLMRLPIKFFDTRLNTETLQRLNDQSKIQNFLTWKGIDLVLNVLNIFVFGAILCYFNPMVFGMYFFLSLLSIVWVVFFLKKRAMLEYAMFLGQSENNNSIYEFIMNMSEIKINNAQGNIINKILRIQTKLNRLELRSLFLNMYQNIGVDFLSKLKEIIAIAICAILIIDNKMTLGTLLSITYVIGQLMNPLQSLVGFIKDTQDANIANERIGEIYNNNDEDNNSKIHIDNENFQQIKLNNVAFKYPGNFNPFVLNNISFQIPENSVTAIVGSSGSGKTTLLKLLLKYYPSTEGEILLDEQNINNVYSNEWRKKCGIVLQDGNIFSGTIAENIALAEEIIDEEKLLNASKIACILDFVESLPMAFHTKIGNTGIELSGGQKQRILIARAVYKNPHYIFFDEATSALDAENEKIIHDNLQEFFKGKTVVIIAHRLSTVKNADQIIVLKNGEIVETGNHQELVYNKANYFNLVKNQLELGA